MLAKKKTVQDIDGYANIIYKMLNDRFDITAITKYLKYLGNKNDYGDTKKYIQRISLKYFNKELENRKVVNRNLREGSITLSRNELVKYITTISPGKRKSKKIRAYIGILRKKYPVIAAMESAFHHLSNCLKSKDTINLKKFIAKEKSSKISKLSAFAVCLEKDRIPIEAGITTGITSGFIEGGNNKIKLIKRQCYGRMKFPRLSHKILVTGLFS